MMLVGTKASGQVRWIQARGAPKSWRYRDMYTKFVASSHFSLNVIGQEKRAPWDATLVFRNRATGNVAGRVGVIDGELLADGVRTRWFTELDGHRIEVESRIRIDGEFEGRFHTIVASDAVKALDMELLEGGHALGLMSDERAESRAEGAWRALRSSRSGYAVAAWRLAGYDDIGLAESFDESGSVRVNMIWPRSATLSLAAKLDSTARVASMHYASPKPLSSAAMLRRARELTTTWTATAG